MANVAAGMSGTFVVNGSPTKTQMVDGGGGRSQIASLTCAGVVLIVLLFLTKPLQYMPEAVLSTVVFLIGIELIAITGMRRIYKVRFDEFAVAAITAAVVVVVGVEQGILLAIVLSIVDHLRRGYKPNNSVFVRSASGALAAVPAAQGAQVAPGVVAYRFDASLYYANASRFADEVRALLTEASPSLTRFCLDAEAIGDIDYSGGETIRETVTELQGQGVSFAIARMTAAVRRELDQYGLTDLIGADAFYDTIDEAVGASERSG